MGLGGAGRFPSRRRALSRSIRDLFRVEPLEPRILLSADPALGAAHAVMLRDPQELAAIHESAGFREIEDLGVATHAAHIERTRIDRGAEASASFQVDHEAFGQVGFVDALLPSQRFAANDVLAADRSAGTDGNGDALVIDFASGAPVDPAALADMQWSVIDQESSWSSLPAEVADEDQAADPADGWLDAADLPEGLGADGHYTNEGTLGGSGELAFDLINRGVLSPGYSPGVQDLASLDNAADSSILIELGGDTAGTGADFHDQINVTGLATLAGTLQVELWDDFTPEAGDEFVILTYGAVEGSFDDAEGLFGLHGNIYFELVQTGDADTAGELKLVAREILPGGGGLTLDAGVDTDSIGELLNADYFTPGGELTFGASFSLGELDLDGDFVLAHDADTGSLELGVDASVALAGSTLEGRFSFDLPDPGEDRLEIRIEDGSLSLLAGTDATGVRLDANAVEGALVLRGDGAAGLLRIGSLELSTAAGDPIPGLEIAAVRSVNLGFNTTGEALQGSIGDLFFDYTADAHHDFLAVEADLDLALSLGGAAFSLSGRFGLSTTKIGVDGIQQDGFLLSVLDAETAITVGEAPGGAS
jgi:hypothetical protein